MKAIIINDYDGFYDCSVMTVSNDGNVRENEVLGRKFEKYKQEHYNEVYRSKFVENALKEMRVYDDYEHIFQVSNACIIKIK